MITIFYLIVLGVNFKESVSDDQVQVSDHMIKATLGDNVILPCNITPLISGHELELEWIKVENSAMLYFIEGGNELAESQNSKYTGRVELLNKELTDGEASLQLNYVEFIDSGFYRCSAHSGSISAVKLVQLNIDCSQTFSSLVVFFTVSLSLLTAVASFISMISWWVNCWFREHKARRRPYIEPFSGSITIRNFVGHVMIMNVIVMISAFVFAVLYIMKGFPYPTLLLALLQGLLAITSCVIRFINRKCFFIVAYVTHTTAIMGLTIAVLIEIIQTYRKVCIPGTCEWYYSMLIFLYSTVWHGLLLIKTVCVLKDRLQERTQGL